jgi:polyisoprenyl-teichoic acid--peptidoglycan teichoic acid transferase
MRPRYFVIASLGLAVAGLGVAARWFNGNWGALNRDFGAVPMALPLKPVTTDMPVVKIPDLPIEPRLPPLSQTRSFLIAGLDRRPGNEGSGLTDTLMVVVLQKGTGQVGLISIPRDTAVEIPEHGLDRINTVYGFARTRGDDALVALKQAVSDLLALPIDHALVVDISVFEQLVDALGGVTVEVPCPIIDNFVDPRTPNGRRMLDVEQGQVRMDGTTAAMYVRSRHGRSDFGRARRQQAVLSAIHHQLLTPGGLGRIVEVWETVERNVSTDFKRYELLDLARRALGLKLELIHGLVLSDEQLEPRVDRGRAMLFPKGDAIDPAVRALFSAPVPGVDHTTVCPPADIALRHRHAMGRGAAVDAGLDAGSSGNDQSDGGVSD